MYRYPLLHIITNHTYMPSTWYFLVTIVLLRHYCFIITQLQICMSIRSLLHHYALLLPWYCILLLDYRKATFPCPGTGDCRCSGHWPSTDGPDVESIQAQDRHFESLRTSLPMNLNYSDRPASNPGRLSGWVVTMAAVPVLLHWPEVLSGQCPEGWLRLETSKTEFRVSITGKGQLFKFPSTGNSGTLA